MSQPWTPQSSTPQNIPNYLVPAILVTVFCCLPVGVVSIIFAAQVNGKLAAGDVEGAMASSKKAKTFMIVAIVAGIVADVVGFIVGIALGLLNNH